MTLLVSNACQLIAVKLTPVGLPLCSRVKRHTRVFVLALILEVVRERRQKRHCQVLFVSYLPRLEKYILYREDPLLCLPRKELNNPRADILLPDGTYAAQSVRVLL